MKKLFAILLVLAVLCLTLTACTDDPPQQPTTGDGSQSTAPEQPTEPQNPDEQKVTKMYITINGNKLEVTLAQNSATSALVEKLKQGDVTYTARDYGGFEKVGDLGFDLPKSDAQTTAQTGDVMLYLGNQLVIFYGSNSWAYTKIGKISGYSASELATLLGAGDGAVSVTLSLQ